MIPDSVRDLYRRWLDELWGGQPGAADRLVSDSFVGHWPGREIRGPAELSAIVAETRQMFAEITFAMQIGPIVEGDLVAARWVGSGTAPEGVMSFFGNDVLRVDGDRFVEYWPASSSGS